MDRIPIETWSYIFQLSCIDGGRTGCALSETCSYFRTAVLPVQLHSVALIGGDKAQAFLTMLERRAPEHRRVEHLFISQQGQGCPTLAPSTQARLLTLLAPTLRTFTSTLPQKTLVLGRASPLVHALPRLEALTMHGYLVAPPPLAAGAQLQPLPALRRLHLLSACDTALSVVPRAPRLAVLRLEGVWGMADALYDGLLRFVRGDDGGAAADDDAPQGPLLMPPTLERVVIAPDWKIGRFYYGQDHEREGMYSRLKAADRRGVLTLLETKPAALERRRVSDVRREWEEGIVGRERCWGASESWDLAWTRRNALVHRRHALDI